jgi:hypothetical protein
VKVDKKPKKMNKTEEGAVIEYLQKKDVTPKEIRTWSWHSLITAFLFHHKEMVC